jgi:hypothetical protein
MTCRLTLTFGSNLNEAAVRNAARPSFRTTANPPTSGEYSISTIYRMYYTSELVLLQIIKEKYETKEMALNVEGQH